MIYTHLCTKNDFLKMFSKNVHYREMLIFTKNDFSNCSRNVAIYVFMDKHRFFENDLILTVFIWKYCNFQFYWEKPKKQKTIFSKWSPENVHFLDMLIISDMWAKSTFSLLSPNNVIFLLDVDIYGFVGKKAVFENDFKITCFILKCCIYWFIKNNRKNKRRFIQKALLKRCFPDKLDIGKRLFFQNDLKKTSIFWACSYSRIFRQNRLFQSNLQIT